MAAPPAPYPYTPYPLHARRQGSLGNVHLETPGKRSRILTLMDTDGRAKHGGHAAVRMVGVKASATVISPCSLEHGLALLHSVLPVSVARHRWSESNRGSRTCANADGHLLFPMVIATPPAPLAPPLWPHVFTRACLLRQVKKHSDLGAKLGLASLLQPQENIAGTSEDDSKLTVWRAICIAHHSAHVLCITLYNPNSPRRQVLLSPFYR